MDTPSEIAGASLETLFLQSTLALIDYQKPQAKLYYWRTQNGVEVDFVIYTEQQLLAFEIKHAKTLQPKMLTGLKHFKQDYPMAKTYLLYLGEHPLYPTENVTVLPFVEGLKLLPTLLLP